MSDAEYNRLFERAQELGAEEFPQLWFEGTILARSYCSSSPTPREKYQSAWTLLTTLRLAKRYHEAFFDPPVLPEPGKRVLRLLPEMPA